MAERGGSTGPAPELPSARRDADERATLVEMLEYYRVVLLRKAWGVPDADLARRLGPSNLTLGGLLLHMALVEDIWFSHRIRGDEPVEPWKSVDWDVDPDWELHASSEWTAAALIEQYDLSISRSREVLAGVESLDQIAAVPAANGATPNVRWILIHMIEEYARHCGHADLIRESIDGATDD